MSIIETTRDIFSILHDGVIEKWSGDKNLLTLKFGCEYLAKRIDPIFEFFFVELAAIERLVLVPWMNADELEQNYLIEPFDAFKGELEIISAETENECVKIFCRQDSSNCNYSGGTLYLDCKGIKIFDQDRNELAIDILAKICHDYWNDFAKKS